MRPASSRMVRMGKTPLDLHSIFSRAEASIKASLPQSKKPRKLAAYLLDRVLSRVQTPTPKQGASESFLPEKVAAYHFACLCGETLVVATRFASGVLATLASPPPYIPSRVSKEEKEAIYEPILHELTDFSKRMPSIDDRELQKDVQYGENGLASPEQLEEGKSPCGCTHLEE